MRRSIVAFLLSVQLASYAFAQQCAEPNAIGVYFDQDATIVSGQLPYAQAAPLYVVLTNPTVPEIVGWEGSVHRADLSNILFFLECDIMGGGENERQFPPQIKVQFPEPMAVGQSTVLAVISALVVREEVLLYSCIGVNRVDDPAIAGDRPVLYLPGGGFLQASKCTMGTGTTVAQVNGVVGDCDSVVKTVNYSWGAVKSLYR